MADRDEQAPTGRRVTGIRFSYGLPTHRVDLGDEFVGPGAVGDLAAAAESAGFSAVYATEHPFPPDDWLAHGGHHALDPLVALAFAAAATSQVGLHTNLLIPAYRNPFLLAKAVSTLDVLSGGRVILGIGVGYLEGEFAALGASFDTRNDDTDDAIEAMVAAWSGECVVRETDRYQVAGNTMLPVPRQRPHPPIWIGGNSFRAIRRAVELGDGWAPFPTPGRAAGRTRTAGIATVAELADRIGYAMDHGASVGRTEPLTIAFVPEGLSMQAASRIDEAVVVESVRALAAVGVDWFTVALQGETRDAQLVAIDRFRSVIDAVTGLSSPRR